MADPVIAIGLDAAELDLVERWMEQGHLPTLSRLRDSGAYGRTYNDDPSFCLTDVWTNFLTGVGPRKLGYYGQFRYNKERHRTEEVGAYDYREYPPFYALGDDFRVLVFDMPQTVFSDGVNGAQILGWGGHAPFTPSASRPAHYWDELIEKFGRHPALHKDHARIWRKPEMWLLEKRLLTGIGRRVAFAKHLLQRERWDLFFAMFSEAHTAGHFLWHVSQPDHPLHETFKKKGGNDPMLAVFKAIDAGLGEILHVAPTNARIIVFSAHGMRANHTDLPGLFFLAELMYRHSFPGKCGFTDSLPGDNRAPSPVMRHPKAVSWSRAVWAQRTDPNPLRRIARKVLPIELSHLVDNVLGQPEGPDYLYNHRPAFFVADWYSHLWPRMRAFSLISEGGDGYIRINLQGREANGIVKPEDYARLCAELTGHILALKNGRTGEPIVDKVLKTREKAEADEDPSLPEADLIVIFKECEPFDVIESPAFGRIGPVPFRRSGAHTRNGFMFLKSGTIKPGSTFPTCRPLDITPTILDLLGAPVPAYYEGRSVLASPQAWPARLATGI